MDMAGIREVAAGRNAAEARRTLRELTDIIRAQSRADPKGNFSTYISMARAKAERLREVARLAPDVIDQAFRRKEAGELDEETFRAEVASARLLQSLQPVLAGIFTQAQNAGNTYPIRCLDMAVGVLLVHMDDGLRVETRYPRSDPAVREGLIKAKMSRATEAYNDVVEALDTAPAELGIKLPEFPPG
jgi:hypothetical protein